MNNMKDMDKIEIMSGSLQWGIGLSGKKEERCLHDRGNWRIRRL